MAERFIADTDAGLNVLIQDSLISSRNYLTGNQTYETDNIQRQIISLIKRWSDSRDCLLKIYMRLPVSYFKYSAFFLNEYVEKNKIEDIIAAVLRYYTPETKGHYGKQDIEKKRNESNSGSRVGIPDRKLTKSEIISWYLFSKEKHYLHVEARNILKKHPVIRKLLNDVKKEFAGKRYYIYFGNPKKPKKGLFKPRILTKL